MILSTPISRPQGSTTFDVWDDAYNFNGGLSHFVIEDQAVNDAIGTGTCTFLMAYNPDTLNTSDTLFSLWNTTGNNRVILARTDTSSNFEVLGSNDGSNAWRYEVAHGMSTGTWYFIAVVLDLGQAAVDDRVQVYINGSDINIVNNLDPSDTGSIHTSSFDVDGYAFAWGARNDGTASSALDGYAHEFTILDIALSSAQVSAIYNSGTPISPRDNHDANVVSRVDTSSLAWDGLNYVGDDEKLGVGVVQGVSTINGDLSSTGGIY